MGRNVYMIINNLSTSLMKNNRIQGIIFRKVSCYQDYAVVVWVFDYLSNQYLFLH